jgi:uncharacterized membrane protein
MREKLLFAQREPWLFLVFIIGVLAYSLLSLFRHWHFQSTAYDLGIVDQTIWHYSRLQTPESSLMVLPNSLGDHFSPILVVLAPFYWIGPKVELLLIVQAILLVAPVFPIFLFTNKRLGRIPAYLLTITYVLFWGIQVAAQFDFHEVSLGVPLVAWAIYAIDEKRWRTFFLSAFLLMLVKEDLCLVTMFLGLYLCVIRESKRGFGTFLMGLVGFGLELKWLIPYFNDGNSYLHWSFSQLGNGPMTALGTCLTQPWKILGILFSDRDKVLTMVALFVPFALMSFASPLALIAVPQVLERMLSDNHFFWLPICHYNAVISPIVAMSAADGLHRISKFWALPDVRRRLLWGVCGFCLFANLVVMVKMPLRKIFKPSYYRADETILEGKKVLGMIPDKASVLAQDTVVPHLSQRSRIYNMMDCGMNNCGDVDYIIACRNLPFYFVPSFDEISDLLMKKEAGNYQKILDENGWIVLENKKLFEKKGR